MDTHSKRDGSSRPGPGTGTSPMAKITEQVVEASGQVKAAVADVGRRTVDSLDAQRHPAAAALERTASALHQQTESVAGAAHATADTLDATADYVRKNDMKAMAKDVRGLVRRYPGSALAVAGAAGFLVARMFRSRD
jgi:ElaB/YqjD/DUF883 family membrane-anchored ribosome-binding protein